MTTQKWASVEAIIEASLETVWNIVTKPEGTQKFMYNCQLHTTWEAGSAAVWKAPNEDGSFTDYVHGRVLEYHPKVAFSFTIFHQKSEKLERPLTSQLHFALEAVEKGTHLTIKQGDFSGLPNGEKLCEECQKGWEFVLPDLIKACGE